MPDIGNLPGSGEWMKVEWGNSVGGILSSSSLSSHLSLSLLHSRQKVSSGLLRISVSNISFFPFTWYLKLMRLKRKTKERRRRGEGRGGERRKEGKHSKMCFSSYTLEPTHKTCLFPVYVFPLPPSPPHPTFTPLYLFPHLTHNLILATFFYSFFLSINSLIPLSGWGGERKKRVSEEKKESGEGIAWMTNRGPDVTCDLRGRETWKREREREGGREREMGERETWSLRFPGYSISHSYRNHHHTSSLQIFLSLSLLFLSLSPLFFLPSFSSSSSSFIFTPTEEQKIREESNEISLKWNDTSLLLPSLLLSLSPSTMNCVKNLIVV